MMKEAEILRGYGVFAGAGMRHVQYVLSQDCAWWGRHIEMGDITPFMLREWASDLLGKNLSIRLTFLCAALLTADEYVEALFDRYIDEAARRREWWRDMTVGFALEHPTEGRPWVWS